MSHPSITRQSGFTLIELSIVIVIIGMLVGGVLMGQNLIRNADLQTVVTDAAKYKSAAKQFSDKYLALPGDFAEATGVWGKDNAACTADTGTAAVPGTCNGNGNGMMDASAGASATGEIFQFWKQLQLEGSAKGSFSGLSGSGGATHAIAGQNVPAGKVSNSGWSNASSFNYVGDVAAYALDYGNQLIFGAQVAGALTLNPILTPEEAWSIDTKIDDGKPASGSIIARYWNNACAVADDGTPANNDLVASYNLSDKTVRCALHFIKAF